MAAVDFGGRPMSYTTGGTSERVFGTLVSASFFDVLGAPMALGRGFRADEDVTPGARPVAVLTHRFWTERLGADPAVASSVFVTMMTDLTGFFGFLGLATLWFGLR